MHSHNFIQAPLAGEPASVPPTSKASCIVLSDRNCVSNSLPGHQLKWSLSLFNLWKQVQKSAKSVDFTSVGALIERTRVVEQLSVQLAREVTFRATYLRVIEIEIKLVFNI
jgi:hypothetical protein